jgi:hypothetical protein
MLHYRILTVSKSIQKRDNIFPKFGRFVKSLGKTHQNYFRNAEQEYSLFDQHL